MTMTDSAAQSVKTPWHTWVVGVISLLWNSFGALDFVMTQTRNKAYMGGFTAAQLDYYFSFPAWVVVAWGTAVFGAVLGSALLLLRNRRAVQLFLVSIVGVILTDVYSFILSSGLKVMGGAPALAFSAVIGMVGVLLFIYARAMRRRRVLR